MSVSGIMLSASGVYLLLLPILVYADLCRLLAYTIATAGILLLVFTAIIYKKSSYWPWIFTEGLMNTLFAWYLLKLPGIGQVYLPIIAGFYFLFTGLLHVGLTLSVGRDAVKNTWTILIFAGATIVVALFILTSLYFAGWPSIVWAAIAHILAGVFLLIFSFRNT